MKKIGFVSCSIGWGGLEMNVLNLAHWLKERDWDITLYTNKDARIFLESQKFKLRTFIINKHNKYFDFIEAYRFSRILKRQKIDTVFVFDNRDIDFISLTKHLFFRKLKVIYQQHMQLGVDKKDFLHTYRFSSIDYWISPLDLLKKEVTERTHFSQEKIKVIPLGTEIDKYVTPKYLKSDARKKLKINESALLMGIIGRIDPKKGQLFLIKTIKALQERNISLELLIIGEPTINDNESAKYFLEINEFIAANNLGGKIHIRNFTRDTSIFYNAIDIFALASEGETYGMVTIEAMLSGLPIIATNSAGTPELLNYGQFGILYNNNNIENFCDKLEWMLNNPENIETMASEAKMTAIKKYSHNTECKLIEQLLIARA